MPRFGKLGVIASMHPGGGFIPPHHGEGALRILHAGLAEGFDAVADGFDTGEGGAAAGKDFEEQPEADGLDHGRGRRQRGKGRRVAAAEDGANYAAGDSDEQSGDEEVGGNHEDPASFADASKIDDRDDEKNADADDNGVRQQGRNRGNQRADASRDTDGGREDVVREQGCRCQQTRISAEIVARDSVGAAAARIRRDGLAVREIDDDQQGDDSGTDGYDVLHAEKAERNEQAESGFGAVGGGAEAIQTKNGNALRGADLFGAFVGGLDGLANE